jgi:beta-aspartyl-peptidase (threonine type)
MNVLIRTGFWSLPLSFFVCLVPGLAGAERGPDRPYGLVIHGGAGTIRREHMTPEMEAAHRNALQEALAAGYAKLAAGAPALDAVLAAVQILEDNPLFNAGKGAVLNADGICELDASVMDGRTRAAGAVAAVRHVRNPIRLARDVMVKTRHVLLIGDGAERFAQENGYEHMPNEYFQTERRRQQLEQARMDAAKTAAFRRASSPITDEGDAVAGRKFGTVGCVALDQAGNLAAGTSTGGLTNKQFGRVGDSPIIGAGTYADNATCAVSCTGTGEFFIRVGVARDIAARMAYARMPLREAAAATLDDVTRLGGDGGLIALDRDGNIATPFNTAGMYRAWQLSDGRAHVALYGETQP